MFYLHQIKTMRDTVIVIDETPEIIERVDMVGGNPLIYSDGSTVKTKPGWTLGPVPTRNEAEGIARAIAARYNWDIEIDGERLGLTTDYIARKDAAAAMGASKSERKQAASRENGRKGGRPRKQDKAG